MSNEPKTVGIGFLAVTHPHVYTRADILTEMPGVKLAAVWDGDDEANAKVFSERYGTERVATAEALLARDDVDAVIVEAWTHEMADLAIMALEAGKAVLLEKPGSNAPEGLRRVQAAVERTGGYLSVGYMVRQNGSQRRLRELLDKGTLGRVTAGRFHVSVPSPDPVTPWFNLENDIGGILYEDGCHMVDLIVDLLGRPKSVTAQLPKFQDLTDQHGHMYEDAGACTLMWDDMVATMTLVGWEANDWLETWELALFGDKGTVFAGPLPERVHLFLREEQDGLARGWHRHDATSFNVSWLDHEAQHVWHAVQHRAFYRAELERFVGDVRDGGAPEIPASHAVEVAETLQAMYESARTGRAVEL